MQKLVRLRRIGLAVLALAAPPPTRADIYTLFYDNIPGNLVSDLTGNSAFPNSPTRTEARPFFKPFNGENHGANYGFRMVGYFSPPDTANYNFYISAMDTAALYLSTDDNPTNKVLIASEPNAPGNQDHNFLGVVRRNPVAPENRSTTLFPGGIPLEAGRKYYIEALHKAGVETIACCDVMAVAVEGGSLPPVTNSVFVVDDNSIPGAYLSMAVNEGPGAILVQPTDQTVMDGRRATFTCRVDGTPPYELQLLQFGVFPVATATFHTPSGYASISTPPANLIEDDGAEYVIAVNGVISSAAVLHVTPDTDVPTLVSVAGASSLDGILVTFSEPMQRASATEPFNYSITNQNGAPLGLNFSVPITQVDDRTVLLPTEAQSAGNQYCVVVSNVREAASSSKTIAASSVACFEVPALSITRQPQNVGAPERGRAEFTVRGVATTPITYQWQQAQAGSDEFSDISGATSSNYVHSPVRVTDNGARFRCRVSANGSDITSAAGAIAVIYQDSQRPRAVVAAAATGLAGVWVRYSEPVDAASATLASNYSLDGIAISSASLDASGTLVTLTTAPLTAGTPYVLHITGVKDTAAAANTILPDTQVSFTATATGYAATVMADEPVVYLRFEEDIGATAAQNLGSLGAPANATYQPVPSTAAAPSGLVPPAYQGFTPANRAATFTGTERLTISEVDVFAALGTNLLKGAAELTIEAWVNPNFASGQGTLLTQQGGGNGIGWLWVSPNNMQFASGGTGFGGNNGYPFPHNTTWHHLAAVMDGTGHKIYFDGNQVLSGGNNPSGPASTSDANVIIGGGGDVWSSGEEVALFKGQMDEVALYRKALAPADLKRHFDAATGNVPLGPNEISLITFSQGHVVIDWNVGGILQSATNVAGVYVDVPGAITPPYATLLPARPTFWRVRR